jgi:mannosyl-oligosaccharide alpha-1,2-mannosidase
LSVFETNIRFVGGLLSCFAITGDSMFREKALHIAERLLPAFNTLTGIPHALINIGTGVSLFFYTESVL